MKQKLNDVEHKQLIKLFERYKEKHFRAFDTLPQHFKWSHFPDANALILIARQSGLANGQHVSTKATSEGILTDVPEERLRAFLDKEDETVSSVVKALLSCGVVYRHNTLFIPNR